MIGWLEDLIERTFAEPPALLGHLLGSAIAARFALDLPPVVALGKSCINERFETLMRFDDARRIY